MGNQAMYQQLASYKLANETVQKTRQLVMLYDAVIRNLKQARQAMEEKRFADRYNLLTKAKAILSGLHCSLDHNKGGDIATMLNSYYIAMDIRINNLNGSNSTKDCDGVIDEVKMMRDAWDKIDQELALPIGEPKPEKNPVPSEKVNADFSA